ncbi:6-phosphogluconolactonase/Glucosamine-6-phosphateisomerase/deaminase [Pilibacter termitis]|uniref:6-phosphogluconolactonase/Glucosamine-6-phosphate isomerase/deaminase n=1 Tax=Pilibacter termitis TaxID=263852 RepID=A0A1T4MLK0_9ENTE|nr:glucosamine-6-phosphate deaminase [Pilibacter termitis]SJZ67628.1 6-phosphogluconolactonase/Glucosamine-6-phosphateisomerase/deaminase [Pilibacter termitis]
MRVIITKNEQEMGKLAGQYLLGVMLSKQDRVNVSITAGKTPKEVYKYLIEEVKGKEYLRHVHYYNFDEIPYVTEDKPGVTMRDLTKMFFAPAEIDKENIHPLSEHNYAEQDEKIANAGGLECMLLGIGVDGHYCGNLPETTKYEDKTVKVMFTPAIKERVSVLYENKEEVPDYHVTMGPTSVMAARQLILIANGKHKAEIVKEFLEGEISRKYPATILKMHPNLTVILDEDAASLLGK